MCTILGICSFFFPANKDLDCSPLDDSLTNIQWLGRMSTDSLGPCAVKTKADKENLDINIQAIHVRTVIGTVVLAMLGIQFLNF